MGRGLETRPETWGGGASEAAGDLGGGASEAAGDLGGGASEAAGDLGGQASKSAADAERQLFCGATRSAISPIILLRSKSFGV